MVVSSGLSLAFMVIGLLAAVFALVVVWRRSAGTPAVPGSTSRLDLSIVKSRLCQNRGCVVEKNLTLNRYLFSKLSERF